MRIGYYPGCSLAGSAREFDESVRAVCDTLGVELVSVPDWNCCGASSAHVLDHELALALPARILAQAEAAGLDEVLAPCAACFNRLASARLEFLAAEPARQNYILSLIEMPFAGRAKVLNILQLLERCQDRVQAHIVDGFRYKVACYYGCLLVRPADVTGFDRPEDPQSMDKMLAAVGAKPIQWSSKTECCGAAHSVTRTDLVANLSGRIVQDAAKRDAAAVVVACPLCQANLDMRRPEINRHLGEKQTLPVLFVTQALGLAMGIAPDRLGLQRHLVPVRLPEPEVEVVGDDEDDD